MLQRPPSRRSRRAQWQRDYRAREHTGVKIAPAPYDGQVVDFPVRTHWLDSTLQLPTISVRAIGSAMKNAVKGV